ncbi:hypothetical protein [Bordetella avium]|nr:hypothetical protein [Bordetella avium]
MKPVAGLGVVVKLAARFDAANAANIGGGLVGSGSATEGTKVGASAKLA